MHSHASASVRLVHSAHANMLMLSKFWSTFCFQSDWWTNTVISRVCSNHSCFFQSCLSVCCGRGWIQHVPDCFSHVDVYLSDQHRVRTEEEPRNKLRGRRRRRSWPTAGSLSMLITWMRTSWSMTSLWRVSRLVQRPLAGSHWKLMFLPLLVMRSGRRPTSCGSGWWGWRLRSSILARNSKDRSTM